MALLHGESPPLDLKIIASLFFFFARKVKLIKRNCSRKYYAIFATDMSISSFDFCADFKTFNPFLS